MVPGAKESPGTKEVFREEVRLRKTLVVFGFCSSQKGIENRVGKRFL